VRKIRTRAVFFYLSSLRKLFFYRINNNTNLHCQELVVKGTDLVKKNFARFEAETDYKNFGGTK
jgi:hypothetical protein